MLGVLSFGWLRAFDKSEARNPKFESDFLNQPRKKYQNGLRFVSLLQWTGLFAVVCLVASSYVFVRNRQVQEADQIRELEAEITQLGLEIEMYENRIARMMDRQTLQARLREDGSQLRRIERGEVVTIEVENAEGAHPSSIAKR